MTMEDPNPQATRGIARAASGTALGLLQNEPARGGPVRHVFEAAFEVATYHPPTGDQATRHQNLSQALANFLQMIVASCPPGPERSTAISRAREAKFWASAAIAMEGR